MIGFKTFRTPVAAFVGLPFWTGLLLLFMCSPLQATPGLSDRSISDAVENELQADPFVSAPWIDIATQDGIVTLSGRVDNLQAKRRATRITETVKGVRAVINTIEVQPIVPRTDKELRDDIEMALLADPATDAFKIDVAVEDKVVTLSGTVNSWQEKELCAKIARGVKGVEELKNGILFEYAEGRPDDEIKQDILQTLRWDVLIDHALVDVDVIEGHVVLSGVVGSLAEKRRAIAKAYVSNVADVNAENLDVRRWARDPDLKAGKYGHVSDDDIRAALQDALRQDPRVAAGAVSVAVDEGRVTLRGILDSLKAKNAAGQNAQNTVGVQTVNNRVKVRPLEQYDDTVLEKRIRKSFQWDPYVDNDDIMVEVQLGIAELLGTVDTHLEKAQAENLASRVNGIVAVENLIVVTGRPDAPPYNPFVDEAFFGEPDPYYDPPATHRTDTDIKAAVEEEIFWSPFVDSEDVDVHVNDGRVTLTGTVDSLLEYRAANRNAFDGGAVLVRNELKIR
jgi:osmotically-inducible protein OsmY